MAKYRRKQKEIEAFQYDGDFMNSKGEYYVPDWAVDALKKGILYYDSKSENEPPSTLFCDTIDGLTMEIRVGYYIVRQPNGAISARTKKCLNEQYEEVKSIHLQIDDFTPFVNENHTGFIIKWSSDIGFGEYTIYKSENDDAWYGDSECMDNNEDKEFIAELMRLLIEKLVIK